MCGYWGLEEPFEGLFTQGMVCHKTYQRSDTKEWLYPQDVTWDKGVPMCNGIPVTVGRSEKMSKSKCNVVGVTPMVEAYGADAVRLFLFIGHAPSQRHGVDRRRHRGSMAVRAPSVDVDSG